MDLTGKTLWQVGAGDTERSYGDICKKLDVMIVGPGDPGAYAEEQYSNIGDVRNSIRRFYKEARQGDIVLLRLGTGEVLAVGEIEDDTAEWLEVFSDVDGWDLQHARRVRWFSNTSITFPAKTLGGQVRTFAAVNVAQVRAWVESLEISDVDRKRELSQLPATGASLDSTELGKRLFIEGLPSEHVDKLMATFASLQRVASWYSNETKRPVDRPSEHETVCYLVIPLLMSLGWSQQTMAVQWKFVDVALFREMPSTNATLACVVEAKLLGSSVFYPFGQARDYALQKDRESCDKLVITDGIRYALYRRSGNDFTLEAYLNILKMREAYPMLNCGGAIHAIIGMAR